MNKSLRDVQLIMLDMLKEVDMILKKHDISYVLLGGSVLGAVRHGGFIPWDDDIDIGILRKDFSKAERIFFSLEKYVYESSEKHIIPDGPCAHLHLVNDEFSLENSPTLDFFPIDKVPSVESKKQRRKFMLWANIHHVSVLRRPPYNRGKLKKVVIGFFIKLIPKKIMDFIQMFSLNKILSMQIHGEKWLGNIWQGEKEFFPEHIYLDTVLMKFENGEFPVPKAWDVYLKSLYGDYMALPPVEARKPLHKSY